MHQITGDSIILQSTSPADNSPLVEVRSAPSFRSKDKRLQLCRSQATHLGGLTHGLFNSIRAATFMMLSLGATHAHSATAHQDVVEVFTRVHQHDFHPLDANGAFTNDRTLKSHGIADLDDEDGLVRLIAIRDLIRLLPTAEDHVVQGLFDENLHVRQIAAAALGIARQSTASLKLEQVLTNDGSPVVRSQAAIALGHMESVESLPVLRERKAADSSRDVQHQCELSIDQIEKKMGATNDQLAAYSSLDPDEFESVQVGSKALDFVLKDTEGVPWRLSEANKGKWVVLIWIFADWCPVCHGEYRDLIDMRNRFNAVGIKLATIECHDNYRTRVMVGKELQPEYGVDWRLIPEKYRTGIWWPHLVDHAGMVGAKYGVDPLSFAVHSVYVNRPSTIIVDPEGVVRFAYYGTFWGDRPSVQETLEMIEKRQFDFEHGDRRKIVASP